MHLPRRLGCLGWSMIGAGLLLVAAGGLWLWYTSDGDLQAVESEARAAGVATTWAAYGAAPSDGSRIAALGGLLLLARQYPAWQNDHPQELPLIGDAPPDSLVAHQAAIPPAHWAAVHDALLRCGSGLVADHVPALGGRDGIVDSQRNLVRLLGERILVAPPAELPGAVADALAVGALLAPRRAMMQLTNAWCAISVASAVTKRLGGLRGTAEGTAIADLLLRAREGLWRSYPDCWRGEVVVLAGLSSQPPASLLFAGGFELSSQQLADASDSVSGPLLWRANRAAVLREALRQVAAVTAASDPADLVARVRAVPEMVNGPAWLVRVAATTTPLHRPDYPGVHERELRGLLALAVLEAELRGAPLPTDWCDPHGGPLLPVLRDGRRIGWYSVGLNGIDDGGRRGVDTGFAVEASLGRTDFADPPDPPRPAFGRSPDGWMPPAPADPAPPTGPLPPSGPVEPVEPPPPSGPVPVRP